MPLDVAVDYRLDRRSWAWRHPLDLRIDAVRDLAEIANRFLARLIESQDVSSTQRRETLALVDAMGADEGSSPTGINA